MATEIKMPKFGETMTEGTVNEWIKEEGAEVEKGEPVFEVTTDKSNLEVEAPAGGRLRKILVEEGDTAEIGAVVAVIGAEDEELTEYKKQDQFQSQQEALAEKKETEAGVYTSTSEASTDPKELKQIDKIKASPAARRLAAENGIELADVTPQDAGREAIIESDVKTYLKTNQVEVTPVAEKMAEEYDINLAEVSGTGPGGQVARKDIETYLEKEKAESKVETAAEDVIPLTGMRETIANKMAQSFQEIPHVTLTAKAVLEKTVGLRERLKQRDLDQRITYTDILIMTAIKALQDYPKVNAHFEEDRIVIKENINLGVAVDQGDALVVPVIDNAGQLRLKELAAQREQLVDKALAGKLPPSKMQGGTFTVTNLGGFGIETFTPIINQPEVAILGVGEISEEPVAIDGEVTAKPTLWLSLSFDHRVIDGAPAAEFLQRIKQLLENPEELIL